MNNQSMFALFFTALPSDELVCCYGMNDWNIFSVFFFLKLSCSFIDFNFNAYLLK